MKVLVRADFNAYRNPNTAERHECGKSMATMMDATVFEDELSEVIEEWYLGEWCRQNGVQATCLNDLTEEQLHALWEWYVPFRTEETIDYEYYTGSLHDVYIEVEIPDDYKPGDVLTGIEIMPPIPECPLV